MGMLDVGAVPAVFQSGGEDKGWGGGSWVFALVIIFFALVFFRGNGFGRDGGHGGAEGAVAAGAFNELNGRFNVLEGQIAHVSDLAELRAIQNKECAIDLNVTKTGFELSKEILLSTNATQRQLADCCCSTQRGIDRLAYEGAKNTCEIITNQNANTQKIVDVIKDREITDLRDKLAESRLQNSQFEQNAYLINAIKPCPVPSYPSCNPWATGVPVAPAPFAGGFDNRGGFGCCGNGAFA